MSVRVIAIDGPAYVGKSLISKRLAELLGVTFINTGHMYRTVARLALEAGIAATDHAGVAETARRADIRFRENRTIVNGADWADALAQADIVSAASRVASIPAVRDVLTAKQREYAQTETIIMEGRDIGSVVFPDAFWKFFVTASEEVRAKRMFKTLPQEEKTAAGSWEKMLPRVREIDENDRNRKIAPLRMAEDAVLYDNSLSPSAEEDAAILHYYVTHAEEVVRNAALLQGKSLKPGALHGTHR